MMYLIITSCIDNKSGNMETDHRKNRYITSIRTAIDLVKDRVNIKTIIVENGGSRETYLDGLGCDVLYTDNNQIITTDRHNGVNELLDIKQVISHYHIQPDDFIIKLTGRYRMLSGSFFDLVEHNCAEYDSFVKFFNVCTRRIAKEDCVLGLFAIKSKYLTDFNYRLNRSPEASFARRVNGLVGDRSYKVKQLDIECCFADNLRMLCV